MDSSSAKKEAKNQKTTPTRLLELSQHPDLSVQLAVAKHPSTPSAALEFLSIHGKPTVLKAVAAHPNTPSATLERLAAHPHHAVRKALTSNLALTPAILERLAGDGDWAVRSGVAAHHHCPVQTLQHLARNLNTEVRCSVASNPNSPLETIRTLSSDADDGVRRRTVQRLAQANQHDLIEILASDEANEVRRAVAGCSSTVSARLATDPIASVRQTVASRADLETATLNVLLTDTDEIVRWSLVFEKPMPTPAFVLEALSTDPEEAVRYAVASNKYTDRTILESLTHDADSMVSEAARARLERMKIQ